MYKPIKKGLRNYISPGLIFGGLRYSRSQSVKTIVFKRNQLGRTMIKYMNIRPPNYRSARASVLEHLSLTCKPAMNLGVPFPFQACRTKNY